MPAVGWLTDEAFGVLDRHPLRMAACFSRTRGGSPVLNVGPGLESDTGMTVLVVGPTEEPLAERPGVLEAGEGAFGRRLLYEPKSAPMTTLFRNSSEKRLVVFRGAFGGRPVKEGVTLTDDGRLRATFGFLGLDIPLELTSPRNYRWWMAADARGSMKDDGLTFGTNANAGVCLHVREEGAVATPDGSASPTPELQRVLVRECRRAACRERYRSTVPARRSKHRVAGLARPNVRRRTRPSRPSGEHGRRRVPIRATTGWACLAVRG